MAKLDKAALKKEGEALKVVIAQARKKTLNFALLQGKDTMYLETHLKKNPDMLRKDAKKKGGGPKGCVGVMNVEGKQIIFSVAEEPPGPFPKLVKKFFMARGLAMKAVFKLPNGVIFGEADGEPAADTSGKGNADTSSNPVSNVKTHFAEIEAFLTTKLPQLATDMQSAISNLLEQVRRDFNSSKSDSAIVGMNELKALIKLIKAKQAKDNETIKAATTKIAGAKISAAQKEALVKLAVNRPKAFDASVNALKALTDGQKPLDCSPEGLAKAQKAADKAKADIALVVAATKKAAADLKIAEAANVAAAKKLDKAGKTAQAAQLKFDKVQNKLEEMTLAQTAAMTPEQKQAIKQIKEKLAQALLAEEAAEKAKIAAQLNEDKKGNISDNLVNDSADAQIKKTAADKALKATKSGIADKKLLTDAMTHGVLAPDAPNPMSDADAATIANAYTVGSKFGAQAINMARSNGDRANIVDGVSRLTKGAKNEFKDSAGNAYGTKESRAKYATNALKAGAGVGGDYFKNMDAYIASGGLKKPKPVNLKRPLTWESIAADRARHVGASMLDSAGKLDPNSPKAKTAVADLNFHPSSVKNVQPDLISHFNQMSDKMSEPAQKAKCQAVLDGITTPPTSSIGKGLVAKDIGKAAGSLTKEDTKLAVMGAMFTPLKQGPVGSCFATGPARALQIQDPGSAMKGMAQIAVSGTFTSKGSSVPIKAVRNSSDPKLNKLPPKDNQLLRSWEYTIATASAQIGGSVEKKKLQKNLFSGSKSMVGIAFLFPSDKWAQMGAKLEAAVKTKLTIRYNATSKIEKSADGSSTRGNMEIIDKTATGDASMLNTKEKFIAAITKIALAAVSETKDTEIGKKIIAHCKKDTFINAVCPGKYKPWELSGGGYATSVAKVLDGGAPSSTFAVPAPTSSQPIGERTKDVAIGLIKSFDANTSGNDLTELGVWGVHAFNGMPNHPSLDKLKGGNTAAKVDEHLVKPGQKIAATKLKLGKAQMIFEKQVRKAEKWDLGEEGIPLIKTALALKPANEVTPKALKALVETAMAPLEKLLSKLNVEKWKKKQTDAGKTVTNADLAKQKTKQDKRADARVNTSFDNEIIVQTAPPEFVIADTNWGDNSDKILFVIIADPISGQPKLFKKEMPSGKLTALEEKWAKLAWTQVK